MGSLFQKLGLVEKDEEPMDMAKFAAEVNQGLDQDVVQADVTSVSVENVIQIQDLYEETGMKKDVTIFKVDEFSKVLPDNLPTETRKVSVIGILKTSGIELEELLTDATERTAVLDACLQKYTDETVATVTEAQNEISELEKKIDELKTKIIGRNKDQEIQEKIINEEKQKIEKIVNFIS